MLGGWGDAAFVSGIQEPVDAAARAWVGGTGGIRALAGVGVTNEVSSRYRDPVHPMFRV